MQSPSRQPPTSPQNAESAVAANPPPSSPVGVGRITTSQTPEKEKTVFVRLLHDGYLPLQQPHQQWVTFEILMNGICNLIATEIAEQDPGLHVYADDKRKITTLTNLVRAVLNKKKLPNHSATELISGLRLIMRGAVDLAIDRFLKAARLKNDPGVLERAENVYAHWIRFVGCETIAPKTSREIPMDTDVKGWFVATVSLLARSLRARVYKTIEDDIDQKAKLAAAMKLSEAELQLMRGIAFDVAQDIGRSSATSPKKQCALGLESVLGSEDEEDDASVKTSPCTAAASAAASSASAKRVYSSSRSSSSLLVDDDDDDEDNVDTQLMINTRKADPRKSSIATTSQRGSSSSTPVAADATPPTRTTPSKRAKHA